MTSSPATNLVRQLVENGWLHLFSIGEDNGVYRRLPGGRWERSDLAQADAGCVH